MLSFRSALTREIWYGDEVHPDEEFICVIKEKEGAYRLYNTRTGKAFISVNFATKDLAIQMGVLLHQWYGEYFWIWDNKEYLNADIPRLVTYTIPNGIPIYETLESIKHKTLDNLDVFDPWRVDAVSR